MQYLPAASVIFVSPLTDDEISSRIQRNLDPEKMRYDHWMLPTEKTAAFEGLRFGYRFKMKRIKYHSSLCNSIMTGFIKQEVYNKTTVTIKFRLTNGHAALLFMLMLIASLFCLVGFGTLFNDGQFNPSSLIYVGISFAAYILMIWRFNAIFKSNLRVLSELFETSPDQIKPW